MAAYAVTRARNPDTGEPLLTAAGAWQRSEAPLVELACAVLRVQLGRCPLDPDFGVDWAAVRKGVPNAAAVLRSVLLRAFERYTRSGLMADLSIETETRGNALLYEVSFTDPRTDARMTLPRGTI